MQTNVLNYRIIIEPETYPNGSRVYTAFCPTLGIADYGDTIEDALASIKDGIELAVHSLVKQKKDIPIDEIENQIIATAKIPMPQGVRISFAS